MTFANLMSSAAVFIALGGGAYAAVKANSVGSKQIKAKSVKTADIADNAIHSTKVANGSLLSEDFEAGQLPSGATGPAGPQGERGPAGATGTVDTSNFYDKTASDARFLATGGTASNSTSLGGINSSVFVAASHDNNTFSGSGLSRLGFARRVLPAGTSATPLLSIGLLGSIDVTCENPASSTISYRNTQGSPQDLWVQNMVSGAFSPFAIPAGGASSTPVTTSTVIGSMARYQFIVGQGSTTSPPAKVAVFDVTVLTDSSNNCRVQVTSQSYVA